MFCFLLFSVSGTGKYFCLFISALISVNLLCSAVNLEVNIEVNPINNPAVNPKV